MLQNIVQGTGHGGMGSMDWIDLALDTDRWMALVNKVMNLQVPKSAGNFFAN
jgi:hypothetical protein